MIENLVVIIILVGTAQMAVPEGYTMHPGDCYGNDIMSIAGDTDINTCAKRCNAELSCVAFLFYDNRKCYPKTKSCAEPNQQYPGYVFYDKVSEVSPVKVNGYAMISELLEKGYYWNECVIARYINTRAQDCYTKCLKHECACFSHSRTGICIISSCAHKVGSTFHGYKAEEQFIYYKRL